VRAVPQGGIAAKNSYVTEIGPQALAWSFSLLWRFRVMVREHQDTGVPGARTIRPAGTC